MAEGTIRIPLEVPDAGERNDIPSHRLPLSALAVCQNMMRSNKGRLIIRPGYKEIAATGPGGRIMGLFYYRTAVAADRTVAVNRTQIWSFSGSSWVDRTNTALNGSTTNEPRFCIFPEGTPIVYNLLTCNNQVADQVWDGAAATCSNLGGSPPVFADMKVLGNRVIGLVRPNNIRISGFNTSSSWPAGNTIILADSGDIMVGMERLNRTTLGVYGDSSQWVLRQQQGSFAVRPEWISDYPGPISARSIVKFGDRNYWLAEDGNVYYFDGVQTVPIGYAMKRFVLDNLGYESRAMSHGVFRSGFEVIEWWFPSPTASAPDTGVFLNVRTGEMGRSLYGNSITASAQWKTVSLVTWDSLSALTWNNVAVTYPTWDSFGSAANKAELLGDLNGQVHMVGFGDGSDNGTAIDVVWEYGLIPAGGLDKNFRPLAWETFFRQTANSTTIQTFIGTTDTLMTDRTLTAASNIDLSTAQRNDIDLSSLDLENRFVTVRHVGSITTGGVEYQGGILHGSDAGVATGPTN